MKDIRTEALDLGMGEASKLLGKTVEKGRMTPVEMGKVLSRIRPTLNYGDFKEVEIIEVLVKAGDTIKKDQSLITVESDKASMEIPASHAGVVKEMKVKLGDKVAEGSIVLFVEAEGAASTAAPVAAPAPATAAAPVAAPAAAPAAAVTAAVSAIVEVKVPDIGDFKEVEVIEVLVKAGDSVKKDQSLITVESDKASMEIPSSHSGVVKEMKIKLGDKVAEGSIVLVLETSEGGVAAAPAAATAAPALVAATRLRERAALQGRVRRQGRDVDRGLAQQHDQALRRPVPRGLCRHWRPQLRRRRRQGQGGQVRPAELGGLR